MEEEYLRNVTATLLPMAETNERAKAYAKVFNVLSPPQPSLREIAQSFVVTKNQKKGELWQAVLERSNEGVSISGKEEESENGASQRGGKAQTSRRPTRKVTGFETASASHENGEMATSVRKTEADMSTLSIGFFRKRKIHLWLRARKLKSDPKKKEEGMHFEIEIDRAMTADMLLKVTLSKLPADSYDVDPLHYELRFPDADHEQGGDAIRADMTMPPLVNEEPVFPLKTGALVVMPKAEVEDEVGDLKALSRQINGIDAGNRKKLPTLSQLSPAELELYSQRDTAITCMIRLVVSPLCMERLIGNVGKGKQRFADYVPDNILVQSDATFSCKDLIQLFLDSLCKGYKRQWKHWMIRKTNVRFDRSDDKGSFWMHGQNVLGDVLKMDEKLSDACPWETVVLLPRSNKYKLEETQAGSNERIEAPKVTYLFTEQTASMYVEYKVVKINRHGTRQERILGIDREKIYNLLPRMELIDESIDEEGGEHSASDSQTRGGLLSVSLGSKGGRSKTTKKRAREIKEVHRCRVSNDSLSVACLVYKDGSTYYFDFSDQDKCAEAIARINFLMGLNKVSEVMSESVN